MKLEKQHALTVILTAFAFLLPWQARYMFASSTIAGSGTEYGVMSVYVTEVFLVLGLLLAYGFMGWPKLEKANKTPALRALVLIGVIALSVIFSTHLSLSSALFIHLFSALVFFLALLDSRVNLRAVIAGFCAGLVPSVILGFFQVITGGSGASTLLGLASRDATHPGDAVIVLSGGTRVLRAYGSFPHPNIFGGYLAVGAVGSAILYLREKVQLKKNIFMAVFFVLMFGLLLTLSRSAALGLALGTGLSLLVIRMKNVATARIAVIPIAVVVIGIAVSATIFAPGLVADTRGGGATEVQSLVERGSQYVDFFHLETVATIPQLFIGHGFGGYVFDLASEYPNRSVWDYQPIHSVPLLILEEVGLLGAIAAIYWASSIDKMNFARFPNRDAVSAFAMGNVVLVILFFDHYLWSSYAGLCLLAFVMALTVRMGEDERSL
ncbi:MAG: O-antigen ligase family protein [Patescibacteria group bacterium]|jgi:hypothetical protein